jgi:hypothetical protein
MMERELEGTLFRKYWLEATRIPGRSEWPCENSREEGLNYQANVRHASLTGDLAQ